MSARTVAWLPARPNRCPGARPAPADREPRCGASCDVEVRDRSDSPPARHPLLLQRAVRRPDAPRRALGRRGRLRRRRLRALGARPPVRGGRWKASGSSGPRSSCARRSRACAAVAGARSPGCALWPPPHLSPCPRRRGRRRSPEATLAVDPPRCRRAAARAPSRSASASSATIPSDTRATSRPGSSACPTAPCAASSARSSSSRSGRWPGRQPSRTWPSRPTSGTGCGRARFPPWSGSAGATAAGRSTTAATSTSTPGSSIGCGPPCAAASSASSSAGPGRPTSWSPSTTPTRTSSSRCSAFPARSSSATARIPTTRPGCVPT